MNENIFPTDSTSYNEEPVIETPVIETETLPIEETLSIIIDPAVESTPAVIEEPTAAPILEPIVEPIVEPVVEPIVEPVVKPSKAKAEDTSEKIALYSSANLFKYKLGELTVGYNIVSRKDSVLWLKSKKVRVATPEEVAQYYNK